MKSCCMNKGGPKSMDTVTTPRAVAPRGSTNPRNQDRLYILAYGTLRRDEVNYDRITERFGDDALRWKGQRRIRGFKMYDLGSYPVICPARTEVDIALNGTIVKREPSVLVDIFEVTQEAFAAIHDMEIEAGYKFGTASVPELTAGGKTILGFLYFMDSPLPEVDDGDWTTYLDDFIDTIKEDDDEAEDTI